jgi:hypothetical protein
LELEAVFDFFVGVVGAGRMLGDKASSARGLYVSVLSTGGSRTYVPSLLLEPRLERIPLREDGSIIPRALLSKHESLAETLNLPLSLAARTSIRACCLTHIGVLGFQHPDLLAQYRLSTTSLEIAHARRERLAK